MRKYFFLIMIAAVAVGTLLAIQARRAQPDPHLTGAQNSPSHPAPGADRGQLAEGHPPLTSRGAAAEGMDFSEIEVPRDGKSIADLYAARSTLAGQEIIARGKVVNVTPNVMGKNWIHLRDGTGSEGTNDLTVTTDSDARVGDTVVVRGIVTLDKDFGLGYTYDIIIENAQITVE